MSEHGSGAHIGVILSTMFHHGNNFMVFIAQEQRKLEVRTFIRYWGKHCVDGLQKSGYMPVMDPNSLAITEVLISYSLENA